MTDNQILAAIHNIIAAAERAHLDRAACNHNVITDARTAYGALATRFLSPISPSNNFAR